MEFEKMSAKEMNIKQMAAVGVSGTLCIGLVAMVILGSLEILET